MYATVNFYALTIIGLTRLPKFEAKSRLETSHTNVWRVSNIDFNEEIGQTPCGSNRCILVLIEYLV